MPTPTPRRCLTRAGLLPGFALVLAVAVPASWAAAQAVPVELRAAILLRALQYERSFAQSEGPAVMAVVGSASGGSAEDARSMAQAFEQVARSGGAGRPLRVVRVTASSTEQLMSELRRQRPRVVYFAQGLQIGAELRELTGTVLLCADASQIASPCVVAVEVSGRTSRLVVDLPGAERSGLRFDARLLQLARVIR